MITQAEYQTAVDKLLGLEHEMALMQILFGTLTKIKAGNMIERLMRTVSYYTSIRGVIHSLYEEGSYIKVREPFTGNLVSCHFKGDQYTDIISLLENKDQVIDIAGITNFNYVDGKIEDLTIEKIAAIPKASEDALERFHGCAPNITGNLTTEEFIAQERDDE